MEITKEQIQNIVGTEYEIVFAVKTGSQLFVNSARDIDIIVVIKDYPYDYKKYRVDNIDYFCYSYNHFIEIINFNSKYILYNITWQFAKLGKNIVCGEFPVKDWDWFNYKKEALDEALRFGIDSYFHPNIFGANSVSCSKWMIWALATYFAIINGNIEYNDEQLELMRQCHDFELPKEYAYKLQRKMVELQQTL